MNIENDDYFPVEPNKYQFIGLKNLIPGLDTKINDTIKQVYICGYRVNNEKIFPFLEYLLQKNVTSTELIFPSLYLPEDCDDVLTLVTKIDALLTILLIGSNSIANLDHNFIQCYKGFYALNENLYMFFDLTLMEIQLSDVYRENNLWFCLIYEILNSKHVCGIPIAESVQAMLFSAPKYPFYVLHDETGVQYEVPNVVYVGAHEKKIKFIHTFGVSKNISSSILGPYYYFTNFYNASKQGTWAANAEPETIFGKLATDNEYGRYTKGGVVRFALFLGKTNVKLNFPLDEVDLSQTKRERLLDKSLDTNYEKQTMRLSDYDGNWAKMYDTVVLANVVLDDGTKLRDTPMYVCKDYERQYPLTYHYLDKKIVGEKYDNNSHFSIM
jgi:hypothetical protein